MRIPALVLCLSFLSISLGAQAIFTGDVAIARRYLEWAQREFAAGRNIEALAALERGADFGGVSSDISYFLAVLRSVTKHSRFSVLEACRRALGTNRWEHFSPEDARFLEAKILVDLQRYDEALTVLDRCDPNRYETQYHRLLALRGLALFFGEVTELGRAIGFIMDRFPRETDPVRILFDYAEREEPGERFRPLIDLALRRLPILVNADPELAFKAVPFIRDREEARRYVASYRAAGNPSLDSLPAALNLGLITGSQAVEELFARESLSPVLDRDLITKVNGLLRNEAERDLLRRNLLQFSGVITEDSDRDGIIESWTTYKNGMIQEYHYDADQDGTADLVITFAQGIPASAEITLGLDNAGPALSLNVLLNRKKALLRWERYPAVLNAELEGKRYIPRPLDYFFTPIRFISLVLGGPNYPEREGIMPVLTERSLLSFSVMMEQPSVDFPGGTERIELAGGIPVKAEVFFKGMKVSETEFREGRPVIQYLDLDMDGRMETIRRYDPNEAYRVLSTESDWDGDGIYEYAETLQSDGSIRRSWDLNKDGIRETER